MLAKGIIMMNLQPGHLFKIIRLALTISSLVPVLTPVKTLNSVSLGHKMSQLLMASSSCTIGSAGAQLNIPNSEYFLAICSAFMVHFNGISF